MDWKGIWNAQYSDKHGPLYDLGACRDEFLFLSDVVYGSSPYCDLKRLEKAISTLQAEVEETRDMASHVYSRLLDLRNHLQSAPSASCQPAWRVIDEEYKPACQPHCNCTTGFVYSPTQQKPLTSHVTAEHHTTDSPHDLQNTASAKQHSLEWQLRSLIGESHHISADGPWFDQMGNIHLTRDLSDLLPGIKLRHVDSLISKAADNVVQYSPKPSWILATKERTHLEPPLPTYTQATELQSKSNSAPKIHISMDSCKNYEGLETDLGLRRQNYPTSPSAGKRMAMKSQNTINADITSPEARLIALMKPCYDEEGTEIPAPMINSMSNFLVDSRTRPSKDTIENLGLLHRSSGPEIPSRQRGSTMGGSRVDTAEMISSHRPRSHRSLGAYDFSEVDAHLKLSPIVEEDYHYAEASTRTTSENVQKQRCGSSSQVFDTSSVGSGPGSDLPSQNQTNALLVSQGTCGLQSENIESTQNLQRNLDENDYANMSRPVALLGQSCVKLTAVSKIPITMPNASFLALKQEAEELESILQDLESAINDSDSENSTRASDLRAEASSSRQENEMNADEQLLLSSYSPLRLPSPVFSLQNLSLENRYSHDATGDQDDGSYKHLEAWHEWKYAEDTACTKYHKIMTRHEENILADATKIVLPPDQYRSPNNLYTHLEDECHRSLSSSSRQTVDFPNTILLSKSPTITQNSGNFGKFTIRENKDEKSLHGYSEGGFCVSFVENIAPGKQSTQDNEAQSQSAQSQQRLPSLTADEYQKVLFDTTVPLERCQKVDGQIKSRPSSGNDKQNALTGVSRPSEVELIPRLRGGGQEVISPCLKRQRESSSDQFPRKMHNSRGINAFIADQWNDASSEDVDMIIPVPFTLAATSIPPPSLPPSPLLSTSAYLEVEPGMPMGLVESFIAQTSEHPDLLVDFKDRLQSECLYAQDLLTQSFSHPRPDLIAVNEKINRRLADLPRAVRDRFLYNFAAHTLEMIEKQSFHSLLKSELKNVVHWPQQCTLMPLAFNWIRPMSGRFIKVFISSRGNEYFCEIDEEYLTDRFNLTGLNTEVQYYQYALDLVIDAFDLDCDDDMREQIEKSARHLYGLVHQRYIITTKGLSKMVDKFKKGDFGKCPRVACAAQPLLPMGQSDNANVSAVKLYCARCEDLYNPKSSRHAAVDGAYFGTTFHNILFQVYPALLPKKSQRRYEPKIFGFKLHAAAALARWQNEQKDAMKARLRDQGLETGFEIEDNEDEAELEDEMDDRPDGIDAAYEGRGVGATRH